MKVGVMYVEVEGTIEVIPGVSEYGLPDFVKFIVLVVGWLVICVVGGAGTAG
jgi:hypothetical protein